MIVGTAGHIDHGKTALVRALTGVDTDRLPEEKRRGITIELGFAPLELPGVATAGIVDVPGHEAFVRTMLAGATGIDVALLVVAADEGVMPQTREHLAILALLGVRAGVVALTKRDLVDDEWLELVADDVRGLAAGTPLAAAPVVAVSALTGVGLDALRAALATAAAALPARADDDLFRMPVDRSFTVRGTGTVATGTVWSGRVARDAMLRVMPGGATARVRGVQSHGRARDDAIPASRAAVALAGLEVDDVPRGSVLVSDAAWAATRVLRADAALLADAAAPLGARTRVRFHLGTTEVGARIVTAGGPLVPGESKPARVVLDSPVVARAGDRFVLRTGSPVATVGGGTVTDPLPAGRRVRPWPPSPDAASALELALAEAGGAGLAAAVLPVRLGVRPAEATRLASAPDVVRLGGRLFASAVAAAAADRLVALVEEGHRRAPLEPGVSVQSARAGLGVAPELAEHAVRAAVADGRLALDAGLVRRAGWTPRLGVAEQAAWDAALAALRAAGREPPSTTELAERHGGAVASLLRLMEREGLVAPIEQDRYAAREALDGVAAALVAGMVPGRSYAPPELRELLGVSRKFLIPLLEYCDRRGVTVRGADGRTLGLAASGATAGM